MPTNDRRWKPALFALAFAAAAVLVVYVLDVFASDGSQMLAWGWYVLVGGLGLLIGGPVAYGLKPKDYTGEQPVREGVPVVRF